MKATENYIRPNLKICRWLRTIFSSVWNFEGNWELYSVQFGILKATENYTPHSSKQPYSKKPYSILHTHPRGAPSRPKQPYSTLIQERFQGELIFSFLLVNLLISYFVEKFMVGHCHVAVVCFCGNFGHCIIWWKIIVWSCWFFFFFWDIFELLSCLILWGLDNVYGLWSFALYVALGIVGWILTFFFLG